MMFDFRLDERQLHEIAVVIHEQVENEITDSFCLAPGMLEKIEIRASGIVERYDPLVNDAVLRQIAQGIENVLILPVE